MREVFLFTLAALAAGCVGEVHTTSRGGGQRATAGYCEECDPATEPERVVQGLCGVQHCLGGCWGTTAAANSSCKDPATPYCDALTYACVSKPIDCVHCDTTGTLSVEECGRATCVNGCLRNERVPCSDPTKHCDPVTFKCLCVPNCPFDNSRCGLDDWCGGKCPVCAPGAVLDLGVAPEPDARVCDNSCKGVICGQKNACGIVCNAGSGCGTACDNSCKGVICGQKNACGIVCDIGSGCIQTTTPPPPPPPPPPPTGDCKQGCAGCEKSMCNDPYVKGWNWWSYGEPYTGCHRDVASKGVPSTAKQSGRCDQICCQT